MRDAQERLDELFAQTPVEKPRLLPGGYPAELFADDGGTLDRLVAHLRIAAEHEMSRTGGGVKLTAYCFARRSLMTREPVERGVFELRFKGDESSGPQKDMFANLLHGMCYFGDAFAVAVMMEAWLVIRPRGSPFPEHGLGTEPDRQEAIVCSIETADHGGGVYAAPIQRFPDSLWELGGFKQLGGVGDMEGRFTGMLGPLRIRR